MTLIRQFRLTSESDNIACYDEQTEQGHPPVIGTLCIQNWALPKPIPSSLRVALDFFSAPRPSTYTAERALGRKPAGERLVTPGKSVTIIKNTLAGIHYPPEWLQQYLGRTGTVLWTTADGAMVKLDDSTTWFSYTELEIAERNLRPSSQLD